MLEIFQISMALLMSLTGMTAAIAEGVPLSAFTLPIALATWYFVDYKRIIVTPRWVPPCLGLIAFTAAGLEYVKTEEPSYLSVGNHLLAYLTWILLLQQKEVRIYWTLFALSVLQIAVTSLLTYSMWFGLSLLAFTLLGTWTLSIFLLYRSVKSLNDSDAENSAPSRAATEKSSVARIWSGVSRDRHEQLVTSRFYVNSGSVTGVALMIALMFFLFIPRIWSSPRMSTAAAPGAPLTGFSTEVRLGDMGEILESNEKVMEVRVYNAGTGTQLPAAAAESLLGAAPLFRGAVLEEYRQGRWHRPQFKVSRRIDVGIPAATHRLRIDLAPLNSEAIFSFGNTVGVSTVKSYGSIAWDYFSNELNRGEETNLDRDFAYDLFVAPGPPDQWLAEQRDLELQSRNYFNDLDGLSAPMSLSRFQQSLQSLTELPNDLQPLYPITAKVVGKVASPLEAAHKIESWLTTSGEFHYTMNLSVSNSSIDPILDFLQNRRAGHCEYFASAMATMLRCVNIPSRVITGFKGGVFNKRSNFLSIQQFHAHAWVEAFIGDHWVTFDPTPGERDDAVEGIEGRPSKWIRAWRTAEGVWHRYSIMSRDGQDERIYQPIARRFFEAKNAFEELMQGRTEGVKNLLAFFTTPERWFTLDGGVVVALIALLILAVTWLGRRLYRASQSIQYYLKSQAASAAARPLKVPFYERLVAILKLQGIQQQPTQTAREFVDAALPELELQLAQHGMRAWPKEVVEEFYRVRFGRQVLSADEMRDLEQRLHELERCLQPVSEPAK